MKYLDRIQKGIAFIAWVFLIVEMVGIVALFLLTVLDIMTIATGFSFQGGVEFGEYFLVSVIFCGLGYAQVKKSHFKVELLTARLSPRSRIFLEVFILTVTLFLFTVMAVQIGQEAYKAWAENVYHTGWAAAGIPTWPPILVAFLGCIVLVLALLIQLIQNVIDLINREPCSEKRTT